MMDSASNSFRNELAENADRDAIAAIRGALEAAENASDPDAAAALLTDDAVLMVPDFDVQEGQAACTAFLREMMGWLAEQFHRRITYVSSEVAVIGRQGRQGRQDDVAFDRGSFSFTVWPKSGGDGLEVTGKYLWLLRRADGEGWKVSRLIVCRDDSDGEPAKVFAGR